MEALLELKKWTESLSIAEKRYISLLGQARSGAKGSQQLALFEWLNRSATGEMPWPSQSFMANLPTVIARLKDLILDGLRLLHQGQDIEAELRTALDRVAILRSKRLFPAAQRLLKRAKKRAIETSRYVLCLALMEQEMLLHREFGTGNLLEHLKEMIAEEAFVTQQMQDLRELQQRHEHLILRVRSVSVARDAAVAAEVKELAAGPLVEAASRHGNYLERILAINLLGLHDWFNHRPKEAVLRYAALLDRWKAHPEWLIDQAPLMLKVCNYYQNVVFNSQMDWEQARAYLDRIPDMGVLAPQVARDYQRILYHNQLTPALNAGNLELVRALIPKIDAWLKENESELGEAQRLPFLHNIAVAEFLMDRPMQAHRYLQRILRMPNRRIRPDIRDFALVLQAVLQYELGNFSLNEYLTRAGKRHFSKGEQVLAFEFSVFQFLDLAMRSPATAVLREELLKLEHDLAALATQVSDAVPLLGLTEMRLWTQAKLSNRPLSLVFLEAIRDNMERMA